MTPDIRAALEAPQGEPQPVAEVTRLTYGDTAATILPLGTTRFTLPIGTKLYATAPPQVQPLTDEQIWATWKESSELEEEGGLLIKFARAIERAHRIGAPK
jgi:hypothetical protein